MQTFIRGWIQTGCLLAQNQVQRSQYLPHLHSVHRISTIPIVETGWNYAENIYDRVKTSNSVINWAFDTAENSVNTVVDTALPAVGLFGTPITIVDKLLCKSLDIVEEKIPAIQMTPDAMYSNTKQYVSEVKSKIMRPVLKRADSVKQMGTSVLGNKYTVYAADTLDGALDVADKYVDKYLPADAADEKEVNDKVPRNSREPADKTIQTIHHMDRFSRKLQRRLTRRTLAEARALKDQSAEAIHVLAYVAELIANDPKLALQKGRELWADLSKNEPENQARPETLEQLVVMLTRESARRVVHFVNFTHAQISKFPDHVNAVTNKFIDAIGALMKAVHLDTLSNAVLSGAKSRAHRFTMFLHQINSFSIAILENIAHRLEDHEHQLRASSSTSKPINLTDSLRLPSSRTQLRASNVYPNIANGVESSNN